MVLDSMTRPARPPPTPELVESNDVVTTVVSPGRSARWLIHIRAGVLAASSRASTRASSASISPWRAWNGCPGGTPGGVTPGLPFGAPSTVGTARPTTRMANAQVNVRKVNHLKRLRIKHPFLGLLRIELNDMTILLL